MYYYPAFSVAKCCYFLYFFLAQLHIVLLWSLELIIQYYYYQTIKEYRIYTHKRSIKFCFPSVLYKYNLQFPYNVYHRYNFPLFVLLYIQSLVSIHQKKDLLQLSSLKENLVTREISSHRYKDNEIDTQDSIQFSRFRSIYLSIVLPFLQRQSTKRATNFTTTKPLTPPLITKGENTKRLSHNKTFTPIPTYTEIRFVGQIFTSHQS